MIGDLTQPGLRYILAHLRRDDELELEATIGVKLARPILWETPGGKWEARTDEGTPAVAGGFVPLWPGLATGWMIGTDQWPEVAREVTKFVKRFILPALDDNGIHRIECRPMAGNDEVARWLRLIGFREEAVNVSFGRGKEDFVLWARTTHDQVRVH